MHSPEATTMKRAFPFDDELETVFGEWSQLGEYLLWFISLLSGILFCKLVYAMSKVISPIVFPAYNKILDKDKFEWHNRMFSTGHAILASIFSAYLLYISDIFYDDAPYGPVVFRSTLFSHFCLGFSCGYFIADIAMLLLFYPHLGGYEYVIHHLMSVMSLALAIQCGHGHIYIYIVLLSECTTPFVNLRWFLMITNQKSTKLYLFNGVVLTVLWLLARVLLFVYCFIHIYFHYDQVRQVHDIGYYFTVTAPVVLGSLNLMWFFKILQALNRTLKRKQAP